MRYITFFLIILFCKFGISQERPQIDSLIKRIHIQDSIIQSNKVKLFEAKQESKSLKHSGSIKINNDKSTSLFEFLFPSIIALLLGLLALFGTLFSGNKQRKSSEKQLNNQLNQARITVDAQIKSSKEILEKQIASADKNAELIFRQNVLSSNRQDWINTLRDIVSEIIAIVGILGIKKTIPYDVFKDLDQLITKAELMVNPEKDKDFVKALTQMKLALFESVDADADLNKLWDSKEVVLDYAKKTLKTEWERVKKGE